MLPSPSLAPTLPSRAEQRSSSARAGARRRLRDEFGKEGEGGKGKDVEVGLLEEKRTAAGTPPFLVLER